MSDNSIDHEDKPIQTILQMTTKSMLPNPSREKVSPYATFHMTANIEWFSDYSASANDTIRLGNG